MSNNLVFKFMLNQIPKKDLGVGAYISKKDGSEKSAIVNKVSNDVYFLNKPLSIEIVRRDYELLAVSERKYINEYGDEAHGYFIHYPNSVDDDNEKITLSKKELIQICKYVYIFKSNDFDKHWQVNEYISNKNRWDEFDKIRALNDHGYEKRIKGILPIYYNLVCDILNLPIEDGAKLLDSQPW